MKSRNKVILGALAGMAIGSIATLMAAPQSGEDTREDLKDMPGKAKDQFFEKLDKVKEKARKKLE